MADAALADALWESLQALPKPVDYTSVAKCALETLPPQQSAQFLKWLDTHKEYLLGRLNG